MKAIHMWMARWFLVITQEQAEEFGLTPKENLYGDLINAMGCRSIWKDSYLRTYRVDSLFKEN